MRNKLHTTLICLLLTACTQGPSGTSDDDGTATDTVSSEQPLGSEDADSPLAYLKEYGGKMSFQTDFFESEPFNTRLKALLGNKHKAILRDLSVQGPIAAKGGTVSVHGCRPHNCGEVETMVYVDLATENILVGYLQDGFVSAFNEHPLVEGQYPKTFTEWAGKHLIKVGKTTGGVKDTVVTGKFVWVEWKRAPEIMRNALKKVRSGNEGTGYELVLEAMEEGCSVLLAQHDLNGDGKPGVLVRNEDCSFYCGSAGCNMVAYDGGRKLYFNDQEPNAARPGKGGVVTSQGVLIPLQ